MKVDVKNIKVSFKKEIQLFKKERQLVVKGASFSIYPGECLAIVGESGSGKSTLGRVISGFLSPDQGEVLVDGVSMYKGKQRVSTHEISLVFQDYLSSVNPRFRVYDILKESLLRRKDLKKENWAEEMDQLLHQVGLGHGFIHRYPHQLSGGQLQRVCIARALAVKPQLIILDEAISSLDMFTQTQMMDLLVELKEAYQLSYLFITHDLTSVTYMCDRVLFFNQGEVIETVNEIKELPHVTHDYAKALLKSVIRVGAL